MNLGKCKLMKLADFS